MKAMLVSRAFKLLVGVLLATGGGGCRGTISPTPVADCTHHQVSGRVLHKETSSSVGSYDEAFLAAIRNRWNDLLTGRPQAYKQRGEVVVRFKLHFDGQVTELKVKETTVDATLTLLCAKAILDLAPYKRWPPEMRWQIGKDYREITFTFYYGESGPEFESHQRQR